MLTVAQSGKKRKMEIREAENGNGKIEDGILDWTWMTSGVKTPEVLGLFGTAEAVPLTQPVL
jgi:hypothetical protein